MAVAPKLKDIQSAVLVELLYGLANQELQNQTTEQLARVIGFSVNTLLVERSLSHLKFKEYVSVSHNADRSIIRVSLTNSGIQHVQEQEDESTSDIASYVAKFYPGIASAHSAPTDNSSQIDVWTPLPIDREKVDTQALIESFQAAYEEVRQSNGYAEEFPEERNSAIALMNTGLDWLKTEATIVSLQFDAYVLEPLKKVKSRFAKSAVDVAISKAIEKAIEWLSNNLPGM